MSIERPHEPDTNQQTLLRQVVEGLEGADMAWVRDTWDRLRELEVAVLQNTLGDLREERAHDDPGRRDLRAARDALWDRDLTGLRRFQDARRRVQDLAPTQLRTLLARSKAMSNLHQMRKQADLDIEGLLLLQGEVRMLSDADLRPGGHAPARVRTTAERVGRGGSDMQSEGSPPDAAPHAPRRAPSGTPAGGVEARGAEPGRGPAGK